MNTTDFKTLKNEQKTEEWLLANGISAAQFEKTDIWLLQAQKTAFYLLKHKIELLSEAQKDLLMDFYYCANHSQKRSSITKRQTYEVMNLGKKLKRAEFKVNRQIKKARRKIKAKRQAPK
jgi:hypothetical protein